MIFSIFNDGFEWCLEFGPVSETLTVKDLVQERTKVPKKIFWQLTAWCCLKEKIFWKFILREFQLPPTSKKHMNRGMKYFQVYVHKKSRTQADIRTLLIWTMLNSTGKMISWMWTLFLDWALILPFYRQLLMFCRCEVQQITPFCSTKRKTKRTLLQNNTNLCQINTTPCIAEKLSVWNKNRRCSWLCL